MLDREYVFTSESVTEGHPDKIADQISDAILDALLVADPLARVACETLVTAGKMIIAGEITTHTMPDIEAIARHTVEQIGYDEACDFDPATVAFMNLVKGQSPDIAMGVDVGGAGDQGMMFGFACMETPELMPAPIQWAHRLAQQLALVRKNGTLPYLRPDGKCQVTVRYAPGYCPVAIDTVLISSHHAPEISQEQIRTDLFTFVVLPVLSPLGFDLSETRLLVNPTGAFTIGGPAGDTGLTGRKIIVDTYGGMGRHGGGSFSGKDATKVDRSAAYLMRYIAKNLVAAGIARRLEVEVAYAIGEPEPMGVFVDTFGTGKLPEAEIAKLIRKHFSLTPAGIIRELDLRRPQFLPTASYGHFGRCDLPVRWEETDLSATLAEEAGTEALCQPA